MTRLNVSVRDPDPALAETLAVIDDANEDRVGDLAGAVRTVPPREVADVVQVLGTKAGRPFLLDLIAHAANGELQLGTWALNAADEFASAIPPGALTGVRLLGCYTAYSQAGQAAMRRLKAELGGIPVRGSMNMLFASDFDAGGFHSPGLLLEVNDLPEPQPISADTLKASFQRLPHVSAFTGISDLLGKLKPFLLEDVQRLKPRWNVAEVDASRPPLKSIFASVDADVRTAPGLLARPDAELLYPIGSGQCHRVTSLFGGKVIRVYPSGMPSVLLRYGGPALI